MDEIKTKQQVVEKIKESAKILVTVSDNPSVDALSAALALTLLFDKQEKYATSIFSGETPPAIAFLEPQKTFDDTTDSLRDFIIALNKEKADHLRYKVEGDSVKIFITPYKTTIDQNDLEFSQGDYNVELVIALGVDSQEHLDKALENHGQILHDAAIVTVTAGDQTSDLGGIDWHESGASSLSEMVAGLAEALKEDKKKSLIDAPIATALLTGIVAETDRFSNQHTTSKVMTVAATLMAAGADQQLIANELQTAQAIDAPAEELIEDDNGVEVDAESDDGTMTITQHDPSALAIEHDGETLADLDRRVMGEDKAKQKVAEEVEAIQEEAAEEEAAEEAHAQAPLQSDIPTDTKVTDAYSPDDEATEPTFAGTLNATTEQAAEDTRREIESDQNKTILSHAYIGDTSNTGPSSDAHQGFPGTPPVAPGSIGVNDVPVDDGAVHTSYAPETDVQPSAPIAGIGGERVIQPLESPQPTQPLAPATPTDLGLPLPPPLPDFSQSVPGAPAIPLPPSPQPQILGDILNPEPTPVDYTANAVAAPNTAYAFDENEVSLPPLEGAVQPAQPEVQPPLPSESASQPPAPSSDPGQFQIPSQQ